MIILGERLPAWIKLVQPRTLVPLMASCSRNVSSNFLTIEGVAAALALEATVVVSVSSPQIDRVASTHGVPVEVLPLL